ncbi:MAG: ASKHA domain-containing protein [Verrucomicrobiota bacterium]
MKLHSGEQREIFFTCEKPSLADVLAAHGLPLNTRCGHRGLCRGCEVELCEGMLVTNQGKVQAPAKVQACRAQLAEPLMIYLPVRSRLEHRPQVSETFDIAIPYAHEPLFAAVAGVGDTAFAIDVGTTTVVVLLVDLITGTVLSRAGAFNEQITFGDNVITRIAAAQTPENLTAMQHAIAMKTIQPLLVSACQRAGRTMDRIAGGAVAGNTTMLHLLTGEDPTPLGTAPFSPRFIAGKMVSAHHLKLVADGLAPQTPVQLLPGFSAFVGADITAGVFASGMVFDSDPSLLVDIGTNGEIVLQAGGQLYACATAAGPAFEGCGLRCGTRAREGAVSDLRLQLEPFALETLVIGKLPLTQANGLCGSAYVDFLATARSSGLLNAKGRFESGAWARLPSQHRFFEAGERGVRLTEKDGEGSLFISEVDVALLLQAKAAIGAGIQILLQTAGLRMADLGRVYLAGGFGMHLNIANAIRIGLLPGFREEQVRVVGNTSLAGALLAVVDRAALSEMEKLRARVNVVDLNLATGFEDCYIEQLMLP